MSEMPSNVLHDFEVVTSLNESTSLPTDPTPTPVNEKEKSIRELLDKHDEPLLIQTIAKSLIVLAIPHQLMWSVVTAIFVAVCQPSPDVDTPMDQLVLRQINLHTEDRMNQVRRRMDWVEKDLPAVVDT